MAYVLNPEPAAALRALMRRDWPARSGARAVLLEGPPGAGKSALAQHVAETTGAELVVYQCHAWTDADELFIGVDVQAAVAGDAAAVRQDGVLARVARLSARTPTRGPVSVVVLIDEIDKTSERAEALLLDWLQSGRVPVAPGVQIQTELARVLVCLTSNAVRDLSDALLRRVRRLRMDLLPVARQVELIAVGSGASHSLVRVAWKAARAVAQTEGNASLSIQEGIHLLGELVGAETLDEVMFALRGWAARTNVGATAVTREVAAPVWAELGRVRGAR